MERYTGEEEKKRGIPKVMDGVTNGWYHLIFIDRWREDSDKVTTYMSNGLSIS